MVVGEGPWFWFGEQANGAGWGDRETETLVSICGKSSAMGQRTYSHKHFDGVAVTAVKPGIWKRKHTIGKLLFFSLSYSCVTEAFAKKIIVDYLAAMY